MVTYGNRKKVKKSSHKCPSNTISEKILPFYSYFRVYFKVATQHSSSEVTNRIHDGEPLLYKDGDVRGCDKQVAPRDAHVRNRLGG